MVGTLRFLLLVVTSLAVVEGGLGGKVVRQGVYSGLVEDNVASCT